MEFVVGLKNDVRSVGVFKVSLRQEWRVDDLSFDYKQTMTLSIGKYVEIVGLENDPSIDLGLLDATMWQIAESLVDVDPAVLGVKVDSSVRRGPVPFVVGASFNAIDGTAGIRGGLGVTSKNAYAELNFGLRHPAHESNEIQSTIIHSDHSETRISTNIVTGETLVETWETEIPGQIVASKVTGTMVVDATGALRMYDANGNLTYGAPSAAVYGWMAEQVVGAAASAAGMTDEQLRDHTDAIQDAAVQIAEDRKAQILAQKEARMEAAAAGATRDDGGSDRDDNRTTGSGGITINVAPMNGPVGPDPDDETAPQPGTRWEEYTRPHVQDGPNTQGHGLQSPILLDLDGDGIEIARLSASTQFFDFDGDGLDNRTAWAGAGDAVLFYDPDDTGEITERSQFVFTEWDRKAASDIEALRSVFVERGCSASRCYGSIATGL